MGLEAATYVSGLTATWPVTGDPKSQGDDHLRLIKAVLQNTFPGGSKPFYFPSAEVISGALVLDATDQNNDVMVSTAGGNVAVTLPAGLAASDKGWECTVVKYTSDANAVIVSPASGTIISKSGTTATIRVGLLCDPARFKWTGSGWLCYKSGPMIGSTESFDGPVTPPGYLDPEGGVYNSTDFAELFAVLATSTLKDKRGRVEAGVDGGTNRLPTATFGTAAVLGAVGGAPTVQLGPLEIPSITSTTAGLTVEVLASLASGNFTTPGATNFLNAMVGPPAGGGKSNFTYNITGVSATSNNTAGGALGAGHANIQSTVVVKKIVRAC